MTFIINEEKQIILGRDGPGINLNPRKREKKKTVAKYIQIKEEEGENQP